MSVEKFVEGKMYRYTGGKTEAAPEWDWKEDMDFMLDGKYHLCDHADIERVSFVECDNIYHIYYLHDIIDDIEEAEASEGNLYNLMVSLKNPITGSIDVKSVTTSHGKTVFSDLLASDAFTEKDNVNHPSHYTSGDIECIDAIKEATKHLSGFEGFLTGNCIKYLWRWRHKNGLEDLKKTIWYCNKLIEEAGENDA